MRTKPRWKTVVELCVGLGGVLAGAFVTTVAMEQWSTNQPTAAFLLALGFGMVWTWGDKAKSAWDEL